MLKKNRKIEYECLINYYSRNEINLYLSKVLCPKLKED